MCVAAHLSTVEQTVLGMRRKRVRTKERKKDSRVVDQSEQELPKVASGVSSFNWPLTLIAWTVMATPLFFVDIIIVMLTPVSVAMLNVLV